LFVLFGVAGGLVATVNTDFIQGIFIIILSFMLIPFGLNAVGGFSGLHDRLAPQMFSLIAGTQELSLFHVMMLVISGLVGIVAQPHHMAVAGSGKTEMNCRIGWCYGNFIKRLCTIGWALTGLIAAVLFVGAYDHKGRELVFGAMIKQLLPSGLIGLMIAAIIGTVIASCAAFMVSGSALFTRNLYKKYLKPAAEDAHYLLVGRIVSAALTVGSLLFALYMPSVIQATLIFVKTVALVGVPMWAGIVWARANSSGAWASLVGSTTVFLTAWILRWTEAWQMLASLLVGVALVIVVSLATRPEPADRLRRFFTLLHTPVGEEKNLERVELKVAAD
jgi:Na+/proline symporter